MTTSPSDKIIDFREADIHGAVDEYAVQIDGYCIAEVAHYDDKVRKRFNDDFKKYFYIPRDRLLVSSQLFMFQRYFNHWGGEFTPECDRDYSLYYLMYLEVYRYPIPTIFKSNWDIHDHLPKDADNITLENLAGAIRRHFAGERHREFTSIDSIFNCYFSSQLCGFLADAKLMSRPEVMLAASINPALVVKLFLRCSSEDVYYLEDLSPRNLQVAASLFGKEITALTTDFKFSQDDIRNLLYLYILQAWLERHPVAVDSLSAEYVLLMFLYLHLYRKELPEYLGREPFYSQWTKLAKSRKENTAEHFREKLCRMREERLKKLGAH